MLFKKFLSNKSQKNYTLNFYWDILMLNIYLKPTFLYDFCHIYLHIINLEILNKYKNMNKLNGVYDGEKNFMWWSKGTADAMR